MLVLEAADSSAAEPSPLRGRGLKRRPWRLGNADFHPSRGLYVYAEATPGFRFSRPSLPQTAISPNECYHSMTRPLSDHPTLGAFTIDSARRHRRRRTPPRPGSWPLQWTRGACRRLRRVLHSAARTLFLSRGGAVYTCVTCRAVRKICHTSRIISRRVTTLNRLSIRHVFIAKCFRLKRAIFTLVP